MSLRPASPLAGRSGDYASKKENTQSGRGSHQGGRGADHLHGVYVPGCLGGELLIMGDRTRAPLTKRVRSMRAFVWSPGTGSWSSACGIIGDSVSATVYTYARSSVMTQVRASGVDNAWASVSASVWDAVVEAP